MQAINDERLRELRMEIQAVEQEDERRQLKELGAEGLAWLALAPAWTEALAEAAAFPAGTQGLAQFLERAEASGVCERSDGEDGGEFWIRRGEQRHTLGMLKSTPRGLEFLRVQAFLAGHGVQRAAAFTEVPQRIRRWAELADQMESSLSQAADWLEATISGLLERRKPGEVLGWLDTAAPLATVFGGKLADSVRLGHRRLELEYRQRQDARHVQAFLDRPDQIAAFHHLRDNPDGVWALHYLGVGGVGKTMLLRFITARLASERQIPVGRIDFDYIGADYPARRPGLLLMELVTELLGYGVDTGRLRSFRNLVDGLHEALSREEGNLDPVLALKKHARLYDPVIEVFCDLIAGLANRSAARAGEGMVLLILDTCEELAKFQPPGARLPSVEATFKILEDVHRTFAKRGGAALPFRVIFAGRRLLAQGGHQWSPTPNPGGRRHLLPEAKPYLALHELRGFDRREARKYLCETKQITIASRELYRAVLRHSREAGRVVDLEEPGIPGPRERWRFNPFDLALYADWLKSHPELSAEHIAQGGYDPYIEYRILERLRERRLEGLLPALVLLGRFEQSVLTRLARGHGIDEAVVTRELVENEWIDCRHDEELDALILQINGNLLSRLRAYYGIGAAGQVRAERSQAIEAAKRELAPILRELFADPNRTLASISADLTDAMMRVLPTREAAELWERIEHRIPAEADWSWAARVLARLVSEDAAVNDPAHPLWPAMQATLATAQLHVDPGFDVRPMWRSVIETIDRHPVRAIRERLARRALLGGYAARTLLEGPIDHASANEILDAAERGLRSPPDTSAAPGRALDEQAVASACAALDRVLDLAEAAERSFAAVERLDAWASEVEDRGYPRELAAFATMLAGRGFMLDGEAEPGRQRLARAAAVATTLQGELNPNRWFGWVAPRNLAERLQLEAIRAFPAVLEPGSLADVVAWRSSVVERGAIDSIDRERLIAASLDRELAVRPVPEGELDRIRALVTYDPSRKPSCLAHERTPHLILSLARAYVVLGRASAATDLLAEHKAAATSSAQDDSTVRAAQTGVIETIRRTRRPTDISLLDEWIQSGEVEKVKVAWPAAVLVGLAAGATLPDPATVPSIPAIRVWASCRGTTRLPRDVAVAVSELVAGRPWHLLDADLAGLSLLVREAGESTAHAADAEAWWEQHPDQADEAFRFALHIEAQTNGRHAVPRVLMAGLPPRQRAQIALEEGELTALRRPALAVTMLARAIGDFGVAGDSIGRFQSTVCAVIARIGREASPPDARAFIQRQVAPAYAEVAAATGGEWPAWSAFAEWPVARLESPALYQDPGLGQWMRRLVWCLDYAKVTRGPMERDRDRVPYEISAVVGETRTETPPSAPSLSDIVLGILGVIIALLLLAGGLWATFQGYGWVLRQVGLADDFSTSGRLVSFCALLFTIVVAAANLQSVGKEIARQLRSWFASRILVSLSLQEVADLCATLRIEKLSTRFRWAPPFIHPHRDSGEAQAIIDASLPYTEAAATLLETDPAAVLRDLRDRLGRRSLDVVLEAPRRWLHAPAWEGILAHASKADGESATELLDKLRISRQVHTNAHRSPWAGAGWRFGMVRLISSDSAAYAVERGWVASSCPVINVPQPPRIAEIDATTAVLSDDTPPDPDGNMNQIIAHFLESRVPPNELRSAALEVGIEPASLSGDARRFARDLVDRLGRADRVAALLASLQRAVPNRAVPYRILHLVGTPVETASDLIWQIASTREAEASYTQSSDKEAAGFAGQLLNTDDLPVQFAPLIVLQLEPTSELHPRTAFDRTQAGLLRGFACKLVTAGAPAVLTLPTLGYDAVSPVVRAITSKLTGKSPPDRKRLLEVARAARVAIAEIARSEAPDGSADAEEPALDVCLMIRSPAVSARRDGASSRIPR